MAKTRTHLSIEGVSTSSYDWESEMVNRGGNRSFILHLNGVLDDTLIMLAQEEKIQVRYIHKIIQ